MSWIKDLYETYENNFAAALNNPGEDRLLPICHTTQIAHIEVVLSNTGEFRAARVVEKEETQSVVPCTESSASRAGVRPVNHPLADKLQYLAGDFTEFGGEVTVGYAKDPSAPYCMFVHDLRAWCASEFSHWKAEAVLKYIENGSLIHDLVDAHILFVEGEGPRLNKLMYGWTLDDKMKPPIFELLPGKVSGGKRGQWQADSFVRWRIEKKFEAFDSSTQNDFTLHQSWISYYLSMHQNKGLCLVSGKSAVLATAHPAKIRNAGDKAKLISSNDSSGFTYRGRFTEDTQVCGVGFDLSQKAHNALRWLIKRQGWQSGDMAVVSWGIHNVNVPSAVVSTDNLFSDESEEDEQEVNTAQTAALKLSKRIAGYSVNFASDEKVIIMGLDSATPGRMSVTFYRNLGAAEFLGRIESWHSSCCWLQNYGKDRMFIGAPSPNDIAKTAYGNNVDGKLKAATILRILPCVVDGADFPEDIVHSCVNRVKRRESMDKWEWDKALGITCAIYKHYSKKKEDYSMALDRQRKIRSYLFGRLLAVADGIEQWALSEAEEKRQTNATRFMTRFADYPCSTWETIELGLGPYRARLGSKTTKHDNEISEIMGLFDSDDFVDEPLTGEFLLGFHCQRTELYKSKQVENKGETNESE